ncbi:MAG: cupredoxin domain-containing protein [Gaiellaceae bacterium]
MSRFQRGSTIVVLIAVLSLVAAMSAFGGSAAATTIAVTAGKPSELKFTLSKTVAAKGAFTFRVTNKGKVSHDFKIAGKKTATLKPGRVGSVSAILKPGRYAFLCTVPGHAAGGMKGTFTVRR